jgi:ribosomal protein S18 acetylase RimI-like enzyme
VRRFRSGDQRAARALVEEALGEHFGFIDRAANPDLVDIGATYREPHAAFFVAELADDVVGTCGVLLEPPAARIVRLAVARGRRRNGIASALLDRALAAAGAAGLVEIIALTEPEWTDAVRFYRSRGFEAYGRDAVDVYLRRRL